MHDTQGFLYGSIGDRGTFVGGGKYDVEAHFFPVERHVDQGLNQGNTEVLDLAFLSFHSISRHSPCGSVEVDLGDTGSPSSFHPDSSEDDPAVAITADGVGETGIQCWNILPIYGRHMLDLVVHHTKDFLGSVYSVGIYREAHALGRAHDDPGPVDRLDGRGELGLPDRSKCIDQISLGDLTPRLLAEGRDHVEIDRTPPSSPGSIPPEGGLAGFEDHIGQFGECRVVPLGFCLLALDLRVSDADRIFAGGQDGRPLVTELAGLGQGDGGPGSQAHLPALALVGVTIDPLAGGAFLDNQEASAILKLAVPGFLDRGVEELGHVSSVPQLVPQVMLGYL